MRIIWRTALTDLPRYLYLKRRKIVPWLVIIVVALAIAEFYIHYHLMSKEGITERFAEKIVDLVNPKTKEEKILEDLSWFSYIARHGFVMIIPDKGWVYSAYMDKRVPEKPVMKLIMLHETSAETKRMRIECMFEKGDDLDMSVATKEFPNIGNDKAFASCIVTCPVPEPFPAFGREKDLTFTFMSSDTVHDSATDIQIVSVLEMPTAETVFKYTISACLPPYNVQERCIAGEEMIEHMEMSRLLGIEHTFFYLYARRWDIELVAEYYENQGILTRLNWDLPIFPSKAWNVGTALAQQDCIYRSIGVAKYAAFYELQEEQMVPNDAGKLWKDILPSIFPDSASHVAGYRIATNYFPITQIEPDFPNAKLPLYLHSTQKWPNSMSKEFTKNLVRPEMVDIMGINWIMRTMSTANISIDEQNPVLDSNIATVYRYRECYKRFWAHCNWTTVHDPRMLTYKDVLQTKWDAVVAELGLVFDN